MAGKTESGAEEEDQIPANSALGDNHYPQNDILSAFEHLDLNYVIEQLDIRGRLLLLWFHRYMNRLDPLHDYPPQVAASKSEIIRESANRLVGYARQNYLPPLFIDFIRELSEHLLSNCVYFINPGYTDRAFFNERLDTLSIIIAQKDDYCDKLFNAVVSCIKALYSSS